MRYSNIRFLSAMMALIFLSSCGQNQVDTQETTVLPTFSESDSLAYLQKGKTITSATFATLAGELKAAMQSGGVTNAVSYCNLAAYSLVDSLSKVHNAQIRRTSLKVRNPKDAPSSQELAVLKTYQNQAGAGEPQMPFVTTLEGERIAFYAPIHINSLCLQCHGKIGETLSEDNYAHIQELYPEDEATGYNDGALRGMWSISFDKKSENQ